ncbi:MAG: hypothetical protein ACKOTB_13835, partial [Planctomycetia bacterium]
MPTLHGRRVLVSFADAKYAASLRRLAAQAREMGVYDEVWTRNERDLPAWFRHQHRAILQPHVRGFGYWIWKPQVVLDALERCGTGDIVHYCDAGCHLQPAGRRRLLEYFELAESAASGVLAFKYLPLRPPPRHDGRPLPHYRNVEWCKSDVLSLFGLLEDAAYLEDYQSWSGTFFVRKTDTTMAVFQKWRDALRGNVSLVDDSPSRLPNSPRFIEHRHDQAVFSCLAWRHGFETLSAFEA